MNECIKTLLTRRSVRLFTGAPVPKETLELILKCGMAAPSAVNIQPWAFIGITNRKTMDLLGEKLPFAKMIFQAGAAIVVCGTPKKPGRVDALAARTGEKYWVQDCSAVAENILLAVHSLGLGAVWTGVYPDEDKMTNVQTVLNIPKEIIPLCVIPIGVPADNKQALDKYKPENIHWEQW